uniref:Uncharacterized protein n=1 Tax=viral metagenome TaxID=1070528 RepID=A0A6C0K931_9ZZZZ
MSRNYINIRRIKCKQQSEAAKRRLHNEKDHNYNLILKRMDEFQRPN